MRGWDGCEFWGAGMVCDVLESELVSSKQGEMFVCAKMCRADEQGEGL